MSTTELLIEHLITGIQSMIWIAFLSFSISGFDSAFLAFIEEQETLIMIFGVALVYPLGIFIDNLSDFSLGWLNNRIKCKMYGEIDVKDLNVSKVLINSEDASLANFYAYIRMRIRVSRSSFINFLLILFFGGLFYFRFPTQLPFSSLQFKTLGFMTLILAILAFWSWYNITKGYHGRTIKTYHILKEKGKM